MRILITGATGFIGSRLVERLAQEHELYALVRRVPAPARRGVHFIQQDLLQPLDPQRLPDHLDALIHQAAVIDTDAVEDDATPFLVNVVATWRLLRYAAAAAAHIFIYASTGGVYGARNQPFLESDPVQPTNLYSLTKAQAELAVQSAPGSFSRIVLRYFFPYGIGASNPIPGYVQRAVTGQPIRVLESGKPALNPLHVSDVVEATTRALYLDGNDTLNIAGPQITSFNEIARLAALRYGKRPRFLSVRGEASAPLYGADMVANIDHMRSRLRFLPRISLREGIAELADHFKENDTNA